MFDLFFLCSVACTNFLFKVSRRSHNYFSVGLHFRRFLVVSFNPVFFSASTFLFNFFSFSFSLTFSSFNYTKVFSRSCSFSAFLLFSVSVITCRLHEVFFVFPKLECKQKLILQVYSSFVYSRINFGKTLRIDKLNYLHVVLQTST